MSNRSPVGECWLAPGDSVVGKTTNSTSFPVRSILVNGDVINCPVQAATPPPSTKVFLGDDHWADLSAIHTAGVPTKATFVSTSTDVGFDMNSDTGKIKIEGPNAPPFTVRTSAPKIRIKTKNTTAAAEGTIFTVERLFDSTGLVPSLEAKVVVHQGRVAVSGSNGTVHANRDQFVIILDGDLVQPPQDSP